MSMTTTTRPGYVSSDLSPRWESWAPAFQALQHHQGTLWIISPFITTVPRGITLDGVRVLTTLDARKLATDSTSITALLEMQLAGAMVKVLPKLHAKVFLRMAGSQTVGYTGSANLTINAERHNKEVMTGPHHFDAAFLQQLARHWDAATDLKPELVQAVTREATRLRENIRTQASVEEDVMVFAIETRILRGGFTLTEERVGIPPKDRTKGLRAGRVDFVTAEARRSGGELVATALQQLLAGRTGKAVKLRGTGRYYAVPLGEVDHFHQGLEVLNDELRGRMWILMEQHRHEWREDFLKRLAKATEKYTKADPLCVQTLQEGAAQEFDEYLRKHDVHVTYGTYLPMRTEGRSLTRDHSRFFQAVRENRPFDTDDLEGHFTDRR